MEPRPYPHIDTVWPAVDRNGRVGAFVTGGEGPIPRVTLSVADVLEFESRMLELPAVCGSRMAAGYDRAASLIALVERGVYVYDWSAIRPPVYRPVGFPGKPTVLAALPERVTACIGDLALSPVDFASGTPIDIRLYAACEEAMR